MEEKDYWLGFSAFPGVGPVTFHQLLSVFGSAKDAWNTSRENLKEVLKEKKTQDFLVFRDQFDFEKYKKRLEKSQVSSITLPDALYPQSLKAIKNPPFVLYVRGDTALLTKNSFVSVVGTRKITQYGRDVTQLFTRELVAAGCIIISGLAMGVDAVAHKTTLDHGGKTIGVLGCGVDCCYPGENQTLYDEIIASGGLIASEVPLGISPNKGTFPARNRIVAALSDGILVTEGTEDSGALITAEYGLAFGKKVFAVPGPITSSLSKGPYKLIEKGGKLVTKSEDIIKELGIMNHKLKINKKKVMGDTKEEQMIINLLANEPMSFDDIVRTLHSDSAKTAALLSLMEIKGIITNSFGGKYSLQME